MLTNIYYLIQIIKHKKKLAYDRKHKTNSKFIPFCGNSVVVYFLLVIVDLLMILNLCGFEVIYDGVNLTDKVNILKPSNISNIKEVTYYRSNLDKRETDEYISYLKTTIEEDSIYLKGLTEEQRIELAHFHDCYLKGQNKADFLFDLSEEEFNQIERLFKYEYPDVEMGMYVLNYSDYVRILPWLDKNSIENYDELSQEKKESLREKKLSEIRNRTKILNEEVNRIVKETEGMSDLEAEKYFFDYLACNVVYNKDATYNQDAYGALIEKQCVCNGFAKAFELLMDARGIPCNLIGGLAASNYDEQSSGNHAWNIVNLGEGYLGVDPTWSNELFLTKDESKPQANKYPQYYTFNMPLKDTQFAEEHIPFERVNDAGEQIDDEDSAELKVYEEYINNNLCLNYDYTYFAQNGLIAYNANDIYRNVLDGYNAQRKGILPYTQCLFLQDAKGLGNANYISSVMRGLGFNNGFMYSIDGDEIAFKINW